MNWKKALMKLAKQKRGIVGLEAAIILIAFVIIAAVFSFMVINQGLFATERGKTVIQEGLNQASTPLAVDGTIFVKTNDSGAIGVVGIVIPLKPYGVKYVAMWQNTTVVTLKVGPNAWANIYNGVNYNETTGAGFSAMLENVTSGAQLFIQNSDGDEALSSYEKGYLVINLGTEMAAGPRDPVRVEIRLEKSAPLTIEFYVPEVMPANTWLTV